MTEKGREGNRRRQAKFRERQAAEMERLKAAAAEQKEELERLKKELSGKNYERLEAELHELECLFQAEIEQNNKLREGVTRLKADNALLRQKLKLRKAIREFFGMMEPDLTRFMRWCVLVAFISGGLACLAVLIGIGQVKPIF